MLTGNGCAQAGTGTDQSLCFVYQTALHEVLHVLGFSARLMHKMTTACLG